MAAKTAVVVLIEILQVVAITSWGCSSDGDPKAASLSPSWPCSLGLPRSPGSVF